MTHRNDDEGMRDRYRELRAETERSGAVPDFDEMMARARTEDVARPGLTVVAGGSERSTREHGSRRRLVRIGGWVSLASAAAAGGLLLLQSSTSQADAEFESLVMSFANDAAAGAWRSPTSSLLDTPGLDLGTVPSVGDFMPRGDAIRSADGNGPEGRDS